MQAATAAMGSHQGFSSAGVVALLVSLWAADALECKAVPGLSCLAPVQQAPPSEAPC